MNSAATSARERCNKSSRQNKCRFISAGALVIVSRAEAAVIERDRSAARSGADPVIHDSPPPPEKLASPGTLPEEPAAAAAAFWPSRLFPAPPSASTKEISSGWRALPLALRDNISTRCARRSPPKKRVMNTQVKARRASGGGADAAHNKQTTPVQAREMLLIARDSAASPLSTRSLRPRPSIYLIHLFCLRDNGRRSSGRRYAKTIQLGLGVQRFNDLERSSAGEKQRDIADDSHALPPFHCSPSP